MKEIPQIWVGTLYLQWWALERVLSSAFDIGYCHIDTAQVYENEEDIGRNLIWRDRDSFWITTKIDFNTYERFQESFSDSLSRLQLPYVDLLLLHRPTTLKQHEGLFDEMMKLQDQHKIIHFWVSNFTLSQLDHAWGYTKGRIFTNQIEYHPCLSQENIKAFCDQKGINLTAYSPLGHGNLLRNASLKVLADKYWVSVAQICIAWLLQQNCIVIPKASTFEKLQDNFQAKNLILDSEDLELIAKLPKTYRYIDPPFAPDWDV